MAHPKARRLLFGCILSAGLLAPSPAVATPPGASIVREINAVRATVGLPALRRDASLGRAAGRQAGDVLRAGALSHDTGGGVGRRLRPAAGNATVGEVLAFVPAASPRAVVGVWLRSPVHRAIVLSPSFRRIGIGTRRGTLSGMPGVSVAADLAGARLHKR